MGLGTPEILRLLQKHYGGIDWFNNKPIFLLSECLQNALKVEQTFPKLIYEIICKFTGQEINFESNREKPMRSREEIMKDYGLEV